MQIEATIRNAGGALDDRSEALDYRGYGFLFGPVGGRIVAEVCVGLLHSDPDSFTGHDAEWQPWSELGSERSGGFELKDLLAFSGLPITRSEWEAQVSDPASEA